MTVTKTVEVINNYITKHGIPKGATLEVTMNNVLEVLQKDPL